MQKAAKRKSFWLVVIASALVFCAPALASRHASLPLKTRAELSVENGQNGVESSPLTRETTSSYYDPFGEVASESSVAPKSGLATPKTPVRGMGNIGSHGPVSPDVALNSGTKWLGSGYKEIAPGVFRSKDGLRQFRMTTSDLVPTHGNIGPHVHFEALDSAGKVIENLHLPVLPR